MPTIKQFRGNYDTRYLKLDGTNVPTADYNNWTTNLTTTGNITATNIIGTTSGVFGGTLTITSGSIIDTTGAIDFGDENLTTTGIISGGTLTDGIATITGGVGAGFITITATTSITAGTLTIAGGSITDTTGTINFGNENLITTGTITGGTIAIPGFTAGSVIFSDGTNLAEDNANFFWDDTNKRLGIGTTSPVEILDINGGIVARSGLLAGGVTGTYMSHEASDVSSFFNYGPDASTRGGGYRFYIREQDGGNSFSPLTILTDGNVGIGTTSPSYKLDVTGRMRSTLGRVPAGSLHGDAVSEDTIFDALAPSIPATNDEVIVNGGLSAAATLLSVSKAKRTSSTLITLYLIAGGFSFTYAITDGEAEPVEAISISW